MLKSIVFLYDDFGGDKYGVFRKITNTQKK